MDVDKQTGKVSESFLAFDAMMKTLYSYFGQAYKGERVAAIWNFLKPCQIKSFEYRRLTELAQTKLDGMNGNLGQRLKDIYYQDVRAAGGGAIVYDPTEDFRYPIWNLQQGLAILRDQGEQAFDRFARTTSMPLNDRARVRNTLEARYPDLQLVDSAKRNNQPTQIGQTEIFKLNRGK